MISRRHRGQQRRSAGPEPTDIRRLLCTARTICDVYDSLFEVGFDGIIAGAGAQIIIDGKEIYHHYIPEDVLIRTVEGFYAHNFSGVLEGTDQIYFVPGEVELIGDFPAIERD